MKDDDFPIRKSAEEWKALLAQKGAEPGAFDVTRQAATERPFTGKYERVWADGSYHCICCGNKLFDSSTKFDAEPYARPRNDSGVHRWSRCYRAGALTAPAWAG